MAQEIKDPIYTAIRTKDASGLRRLAATARGTEQRMWLRLLAEIIEDQVQLNIRGRRHFPFVGVRRSRLSVR